MGVDLMVYRIRVGTFLMPKRVRTSLPLLKVSKYGVSASIRVALIVAMLIVLVVDIELNPVRPEAVKQKTLSFGDTSMQMKILTVPQHLRVGQLDLPQNKRTARDEGIFTEHESRSEKGK